jgi:hypothetical protein
LAISVEPGNPFHRTVDAKGKVFVRQYNVNRFEVDEHNLAIDEMEVIQLDIILQDPEVRGSGQSLAEHPAEVVKLQ